MNFYEQIKQIPRWVCWDFEAYKAWDTEALKRWEALSDEDRKCSFKKWSKNPHKKPLQPNGKNAGSTYPSTWSSYDEIPENYSAGFVLSDTVEPIEPIVVIDLDHCRNKETNMLTDYAVSILKLCRTGCEISQSGEGLHLFGYGRVPCAIKTKTIEVYGTERYICTTGNILLDLPLKNIQKALNIIYSSHKEYKKRNIKIEKGVQISSSELDKLLENKRFQQLWDKEIEYLKDGGGYDWSLYDFHIARALNYLQPEKVLWIMQDFRRRNGAPRKHLKALQDAINKTSKYKEIK